MRLAAILFFLVGVAFAQVQNAADAAAGAYNVASVAPGSLAFIADYSAPNPPTINGAVASIRPVGTSTAIPAQIVNASATGMTFLVPLDAPLGPAQLIYHQPGELTQSADVIIGANDFALYRTGTPGPLNALNENALGVTSANGLANPAQPGQTVQIFGTGIGTLPPSLPQITLGGVSQGALFAGNAPGQPGVNQINFRVAPGTPDGCYLPLAVTWGTSTVTSFLSKTSDGMPCHHPFGLPVSALQALDAGGTITTGLISMSTSLNAASAQKASHAEGAGVSFYELTAANFVQYFAPPQCNTVSAAFGYGGLGVGTVVGTIFDPTTNGSFPSPFGPTMTLQNGASMLRLTNNEYPGDGDYQATVASSGDAPLSQLPAPVIAAGQWTWSAAMLVFPAASFHFSLPGPIQINGGSPLSLSTGHDQTITWNGGSFGPGTALQLTLGDRQSGIQYVACSAPAQAGTLTIPASFLTSSLVGSVSALTISMTEYGAGMPAVYLNLRFSQVLMLVSWTTTDTRPVDFK